MCPEGNNPPVGPTPPGRPPADDPVGDVALAWALAVAGVALVSRLLPAPAARPVGAAIWIVTAVGFALARGHLGPAGLVPRRPGRALRATAIYAAIFLPPFALVFAGWQGLRGAGAPRLASGEVFFSALVANFFFAGLPEECFFRGLVQPRLAERFGGPIRRPLPWVPITPAVALAAALFAATHVVFEFDLWSVVSLAAGARLLTFFPGLLFGALREETGDVLAPALFHALCNALLAWLQEAYA
jgi:membrane protease YdiL (CAAX protease family)